MKTMRNPLPLLAALALAGCGGGSGSSSPDRGGALVMKINWPHKGRFVPGNAQFARATVTKLLANGNPDGAFTPVIVDFASTDTQPQAANNLDAGDYRVAASTFRENPALVATAKALSTGQVTVHVNAGQRTACNLLLNPTFASLVVRIDSVQAQFDETREYPKSPTVALEGFELRSVGFVYRLSITPRAATPPNAATVDLPLFNATELTVTGPAYALPLGVVDPNSATQAFTFTPVLGSGGNIVITYTDNGTNAGSEQATYTIPISVG